MDKHEIERRLGIAELAARYYQSLLDENPIAVQFFVRDDWRDVVKPTFNLELNWREKPKEPKVIYRWTDKNGSVWHSASAICSDNNANVVERYVQDMEWTPPS